MSDSLASNELHEFHADDTYNPVEPLLASRAAPCSGCCRISLSVDRVLGFVAQTRPPADSVVRPLIGPNFELSPTKEDSPHERHLAYSKYSHRPDRLRRCGGRNAARFRRRIPAETRGSPQRWAARPLVAHNTEFKRQQVLRLEAIRDHKTPPPFPEIDHGSEEVYRRYSEQSLEAVREDSRRTTKALIDEVGAALDEDLLDPSRNPWLGRTTPLVPGHRPRLLAPDRTCR